MLKQSEDVAWRIFAQVIPHHDRPISDIRGRWRGSALQSRLTFFRRRELFLRTRAVGPLSCFHELQTRFQIRNDHTMTPRRCSRQTAVDENAEWRANRRPFHAARFQFRNDQIELWTFFTTVIHRFGVSTAFRKNDFSVMTRISNFNFCSARETFCKNVVSELKKSRLPRSFIVPRGVVSVRIKRVWSSIIF